MTGDEWFLATLCRRTSLQLQNYAFVVRPLFGPRQSRGEPFASAEHAKEDVSLLPLFPLRDWGVWRLGDLTSPSRLHAAS